jgi:transcriptional regulator with XRE-family HTH domain
MENLAFAARQYGSPAELCDAAGISRQQFTRYLNGETMPSLATLEVISRVSGIPLHQLLSKRAAAEPDLRTANIERLAEWVSVSRQKEPILGYFFEIVLVEPKKRKCAVSLSRIWRDGSVVRYRRKMPIPVHTGTKGRFWTFDGHVTVCNHSVNIVYINSNLKTDLGFQMAVLHDARIGDLFGLKASMSSFSFPRPVAIPSYFVSLGKELEIATVKPRLSIFELAAIQDPMLQGAASVMSDALERMKSPHVVRLF